MIHPSFSNSYFQDKVGKEYPCPLCDIGLIELQSTDFSFPHQDFKEEITGYDDEGQEYYYDLWDHPGSITGTFTAKFMCNRSQCKAIVSACGKSNTVEEADPYYGSEVILIHYPKYFQPTLKVFSIPKACPHAISLVIHECFELLLLNPSSCLNKIRIVLELILDHLKVPRTKSNKSGKQSLHQRISYLEGAQEFKMSKYLNAILALKWIGNAGSHDVSAKYVDALDGLQILDLLVTAIFDISDSRLVKIIDLINEKKRLLKHEERNNLK